MAIAVRREFLWFGAIGQFRRIADLRKPFSDRLITDVLQSLLRCSRALSHGRGEQIDIPAGKLFDPLLVSQDVRNESGLEVLVADIVVL